MTSNAADLWAQATDGLTANQRFRSQELVRTVVEFALHHVPHLSQYAKDWPVDSSLPLTPADKVLVETALLGLVLARNRDLAPRGSIGGALAEAVRSSLDVDRLTMIARRQPQVAPSLGILVAFLRQEGMEPAALGEAVELAFASGRAYATERLPYRQIETHWVEGQLWRTTSAASEEYRASVLYTGLDAMYATFVDAYAFTHATMFLSDFGWQPVDRGLDYPSVSQFVDEGCCWQLANDNLDIAGELIMSAGYLRLRPSPHVQVAYELLLSTWEALKFLPSPSLRIDELKGLPTYKQPGYSFLHVYHTNYVGALACAAQLALPNADPSQVAGVAAPAASDRNGDRIEAKMSRLLDLTRTRRTAVWISALLQQLEIPNVGGVLSDMILIEACRGYRFDVVQAELEDLSGAEQGDSATARKARRFLADHCGSSQ